MEPHDEILDVSAAAARLGISPDGVRKRIQRGTLRGQKVEGVWRVILPAVESPVGSDRTDRLSRTVSDSMIAQLLAERAQMLETISSQARTIEALSTRPELPAGTTVPTVGPIGPEPVSAVADTEGSSPIGDTPTTPPARRGWLRRLLGR